MGRLRALPLLAGGGGGVRGRVEECEQQLSSAEGGGEKRGDRGAHVLPGSAVFGIVAGGERDAAALDVGCLLLFCAGSL